MIKLLSKIFIKDKDGRTDLRQAYGMLCSAVGIALNIVLFAIKFIAGSLSGAISVTADAFNNLSDSGSSIITMLGFRLAAKKPDPNHPFGHGRVEYLSGIAVSVLIIIMGVELLTSSVQKIFSPEEPEISAVVFAILGVSVAVKLYMFLYNRKYGRLYSSAAMTATSADSLSDAVSTSVVLLSMVFTYFTHINIDAYCGAAVALFILYAGAKSAYETIQPLLGQPPEKEFVDKLTERVMSFDGVVGVHDMMIHDYGPGRLFGSLHAEVPSTCDIMEIHDTIDVIEHTVWQEFGMLLVIHLDPIVVDDEFITGLRRTTLERVQAIDPELSIHDFRVVTGPSHTNLIFDLVTPHNFRYSDAELSRMVQETMHEENERYFVVVQVERNFV